MNVHLPATSRALLLRGKPWQWALLSAGLSLGITALSPGMAEAQVRSRGRTPAPAPVRSVINIPTPATQLSRNRAVLPITPSPLTSRVTTSSVVNSITQPAPRSSRGRRRPLYVADPQTALTEAVVTTTAAGFPLPVTSVAAANGGATSAPAPLPLLGAGVAFAYSRRVRRRISQGTSGESTPAVAHS